MKFLQLRYAFERITANGAKKTAPTPGPPRDLCQEEPHPIPPPPRIGPIEKVVGGEVIWKPIDRVAAKMIAKSPWIHRPPIEIAPKSVIEEKPKEKSKPKRKDHGMGTTITTRGQVDENLIPGSRQTWVSEHGIRCQRIGNETYMNVDDLDARIMEKVASCHKELNPAIKTAEDTRKILDELLRGVGGDMEQFRANATSYLTEIRQTRFAIVSEVSSMTTALKDVRAFFVGPNHESEVARLKDFVGICERLKALKDSGFLDLVADTMIRLASEPQSKA